jgi:hypothetical protein
MKSTLLLLFLSVALACTATAADISGKWSGTFVAENGDSGTAYVILKQSGSTITGSGGPDANEQWPALQGTIDGNKISLQVKSTTDGRVYNCALVLDADHLKGEVHYSNTAGEIGNAKLDLTRVTE